MKGKFLRTAAAATAAVLLFSQTALAAPEISAASAILMDSATGRVLFEQNADERSLIASTTKIMTGLLVCEAGGLEETVTVPAEAAGVEGSSMYLKAGERLSRRALLYGLLLESGNDAAVALAILDAGDVGRFVEKMNRRAAALGLKDTRFANPNGLDDGNNYSTARELAILAARAMENVDFCEAAGKKRAQAAGRTLVNHNRLLWQYEGAIGVKTGYTRAAGRILVSCAERGGRRLFAVTIRDRDDWRDHAALLDCGFGLLRGVRLLEPGQTAGQIPVVSGAAQTAALCVRAPLEAMLFPGERAELVLLTPAFVYAPVAAGEPGGMAELRVGGKTLCRQTVFYEQDVAVRPEGKKSLWRRLIGGIKWKNACRSSFRATASPPGERRRS